MTLRGARVRTVVVVLLVSLIALWGLATAVTGGGGLNVLWGDTLDPKLDPPAAAPRGAPPQERRLSVVYVGGDTDTQRGAMLAQRSRTDAARSALTRLADDADVRLAASTAREQRVR